MQSSQAVQDCFLHFSTTAGAAASSCCSGSSKCTYSLQLCQGFQSTTGTEQNETHGFPGTSHLNSFLWTCSHFFPISVFAQGTNQHHITDVSEAALFIQNEKVQPVQQGSIAMAKQAVKIPWGSTYYLHQKICFMWARTVQIKGKGGAKDTEKCNFTNKPLKDKVARRREILGPPAGLEMFWD